MIVAVATVALISFVTLISRVKEDTAIAIRYTDIFALGVVAVSIFRHYIHIDLMHFIMGNILGVADADLWVGARKENGPENTSRVDRVSSCLRMRSGN